MFTLPIAKVTKVDSAGKRLAFGDESRKLFILQKAMIANSTAGKIMRTSHPLLSLTFSYYSKYS
jgi:hypothetical protein